MNQENEPQKIIVDVPTERGALKPLPLTPTQSRMEAFKRGWGNAIALPDNLPDLLFDLTASIAIPTFISSCWTALPLPEFIRFALMGLVVVALGFWQVVAIAEIQEVLAFRLALIVIGVFLGCGL